MKRVSMAAALVFFGMIGAQAAEPLVGDWTTASGETARIAACGGAYCITLATGKFKGRQIGKLSGGGSQYEGEITDPNTDKTYAGSADVAKASMKLTGCALKIFCKTQTWARQ